MNVVASASITGKQRLYLSPQFRIAVASLIKQNSAMLLVAFRSAMKQFLDLRPTFRSQGVSIRFALDGGATLPPSSNRAGRL